MDWRRGIDGISALTTNLRHSINKIGELVETGNGGVSEAAIITVNDLN
jgi:hypothetical protein